MMYPYLFDVLEESKKLGLTVAIISNGSLLDTDAISKINQNVDWIGISLDSGNESTQSLLKRGQTGHVARTLENSQIIKDYGVRLKINTVVTSLNQKEDMKPIIRIIDPRRWKVFQFLPRPGENESNIDLLKVTSSEFTEYSKRNAMRLSNGASAVFESNDIMRDSYLMIDPMGRFFHSARGPIEYIPTNPRKLKESISDAIFNHNTFENHGGVYNWNTGCQEED